jgi:hypothetical protein
VLKVLSVRYDRPPELLVVDGSLGSLQKLVGGDIEAVHFGAGVSAYINENGKAGGLPVNPLVSAWAWLTDIGLLPGDMIVGHAVFVGDPLPDDEEGRDTDVPEEFAKKFKRFAESGIRPTA